MCTSYEGLWDRSLLLVREALGESATARRPIAGWLAQVREKLQRLDGYFLKLADAMEAWIDAWEQLNPAQAPAASSESQIVSGQHAMPNGKAS